MDKVFISKTPKAVSGTFQWNAGTNLNPDLKDIEINVQAGENRPAGPMQVKVSKTGSRVIFDETSH